MKVKCIANRGIDLFPQTIEAGTTIKIKFDLNICKVYVVYGILLYNQTLKYLISDEQYDSPYWYPAELFEIIDHSLPINWHFNFYGYSKHPEYNIYTNAIWGYKEFLDLNHYTNIIERLGNDRDIFFKRKKEINLDENFRDYMKTLTCKGQAKIKNKEYVIQKMLELHDVNFMELIFFGMAHGFVDNVFVVDFAMKALEYEKFAKDTTWIEIAGLLKNEYDKTPILVEKEIKSKNEIITTKSSIYNKVWFYLALAADISDEGILK